jgi:hypothetical protein
MEFKYNPLSQIDTDEKSFEMKNLNDEIVESESRIETPILDAYLETSNLDKHRNHVLENFPQNKNYFKPEDIKFLTFLPKCGYYCKHEIKDNAILEFKEIKTLSFIALNHGQIDRHDFKNKVWDLYEMFPIGDKLEHSEYSSTGPRYYCNKLRIKKCEKDSDIYTLLSITCGLKEFHQIQNPSEWLCKTSVSLDFSNLKYIKNPSEDVQMIFANKSNFSELLFRFVENVSDNVKDYYIKNGYFSNIKNPTERDNRKALEKDINNFKYIKNPSFEIQMYVFNKCPKLLDRNNMDQRLIYLFVEKERRQKSEKNNCVIC